MLENVGRAIFVTLALVLGSVVFLTVKNPPFELGLDIQGGTRLVYTVDFEQAYEDGTLDRSENEIEVLNQLIQIIRNRVDPDGVLEPIIRAAGRDRIIIELPGTLGLPTQEARGKLAEPLLAGDALIKLAAGGDEFPLAGEVTIGGEDIRYEGNINGLNIQKDEFGRLTGRPQALDHEAGEDVVLKKDDAFRAKIESLGEMTFQIVATGSNVPVGVDLTEETSRMKEWCEANPNVSLTIYNRLGQDDGGPHSSIEWVPWNRFEQNQDQSLAERALPLLRPTSQQDTFTGSALKRVYAQPGPTGRPVVGFEVSPTRVSDFADFTGDNKNERMAIVLNDEVRSAPNLEDRLTGGGIIKGSFTDEEVKSLVTVLRSGSLKIRPTLEHDERVGATLGDDYVRRGAMSAVIAVIAVLAFILFYYRRLGVLASISLLASFLMLMGALSFGNATLTLPGIAGIILTVGMAVDANILIFDRIREERDKGRNIKQAARDGFDRAMPAILDANITTFLTALILRQVGSGPVRGFAVTLMWGIVTSVFAALVITRLLVHFSLERGTKEFKVGQWMVTAQYAFMNKAKVAAMTSTAVILLGVGLFASLPASEKLGIDFLGGAEAQLRTLEPQSVDTMRAAIGGIEGIGESAVVSEIKDSARDGGYTLFRTTFKTAVGGQDLGSDSEIRSKLEEGLEGLLSEKAVRVSLEDDTKADVRLFFGEQHQPADIQAVLESRGFSNVEVAIVDDKHYTASADVALGSNATELEQDLDAAFRSRTDSQGNAFRLEAGIPSYTSVSAQVVGELRDSALLAIAISLFVIVLYIRVRFAEYSYGYAAVAALLHDVLVTLGALTAANFLGLVNGEINLPMIAAFLTIIGYSLNDTIVIFDRVRENLPRMRKPFSEVLNESINQTLSRTILTSFTTFLAVAILYVFNFGTGNVLESFSFAMMIGVLTGTYSTVFVANPLLLWLEKRAGHLGEDGAILGRALPKTPAPKTPKGKGGLETAQV